jgi:hypothetical protein
MIANVCRECQKIITDMNRLKTYGRICSLTCRIKEVDRERAVIDEIKRIVEQSKT